jgi:hypothetical protein
MTLNPKYMVGDVLVIRHHEHDGLTVPDLVFRVTGVRCFDSERIGYELDVCNQEHAGFPFSRAHYFENELVRFHAERVQPQ